MAGAVGAVTGGLGNIAVKAAASGATTATRAVVAAATTSGAAAAGGKHVEGAWKGQEVSAKDVGIAAAGGALGGGGAAKIAVGVEKSIANAAAKLDNVSAGIVATTVGAIKGGGPTQVMTTAGAAAGQQAVNAGAAVGQKIVEERTK